MKAIRLGLNVDHVATVRQARRGAEPDPCPTAAAGERGGADSIVCHLREDRRHIQDRDVVNLRRAVRTVLNLEMGLAPDIIRAALRIRPDQVTLVPERRQELTTEGGLDVAGQLAKIRRAVKQFLARGIRVSLFVDPDVRQIDAAARVGAPIVEIHTGGYANARASKGELRKIVIAAREARRRGIVAAAGHGLDYRNVRAVAAITEIEELNIGHSIVARALLVGMEQAVREMKALMRAARKEMA